MRVCVCACVCVCVMCVPLQFSGSHLGAILPSRRHLAMSGDIFGGHCWEEGSGYCVKDKNAAKHLTRHRTVPIPRQKNHLVKCQFTYVLARTVKNLPTMQETRVRPRGWEDSLEMGVATHSSILAWRIPSIEEPGGLQSKGLQRVGQD